MNERTGEILYGNGGSGFDSVNTVERVVVDDVDPSDRFTIHVIGSDVPLGPQPYALVISGPIVDVVAVTEEAAGGSSSDSINGYIFIGAGVISALVVTIYVLKMKKKKNAAGEEPLTKPL